MAEEQSEPPKIVETLGMDPVDDLADGDDSEIVIIPGINDLPEFATQEAHRYHRSNLKKEKEIERMADELFDIKDRVKVMKEHFKNVQQEVEHTNGLHNAKKAEVATEQHLNQLTSRALGRAQKESRQLQVDIEFVQEQLNSVQSMIYKANEKMDEFKMQMNWNQEELEQWAVASKQKEDDHATIEKYKRADELKIKELTLTLEHLTKAVLEKKQKLENETTDTLAKQVELDRIAQDFKNAHLERQSLVNRWQETIDEMKRRDAEINALGERFAAAKADRIKKEALTVQQRKRLTDQQGENREVETRSETLSRIVLRKREEMMVNSGKLSEFRSELESLKSELTSAAEGILSKRSSNTHKTQAVEEKKVQLERERQKYQVVKGKVEIARSNTNKAEMTAKEAEQALNETENNFNAELARLKSLNEQAIKEQQTVHNLKTEESRLKNEIHGSKTIAKNLEHMLNQLDKEAARQQELLYNAEFQIQQIERKIARGLGERSDEEKVALKKQISGLEEKKDQVHEQRKMLLNQSRKLHNELALYKQRRDEGTKHFTKLTEALAEKELENKMMEEEIKRETKEMEEVSVQNDLLRLELRRLKDLLSAKSDAVFSLENRKQQLLLSMEERKQEINVHRDILQAELRALNADRHNITVELNQRQQAVERLKARFESVARPDEAQHSQSYYIIKAAQKREELQRRGDQLDQDVRRCEREIRALQVTLDHLTTRNAAYRESFQKISVKGDEAEILQQLEERTKLNKDALFRKKKDLQRLITDYDEDARRLEQVRSQCDKMLKQQDHLQNAKNQVEEEIRTQHAQLDELGDKMEKISKRHQKKLVDNGIDPNSLRNGSLEEKSAKAEVLKDVIQNVLYTLGQLANEFPEVSETLQVKLQDADLRLPTKPPSRNFKVTVSKSGQ